MLPRLLLLTCGLLSFAATAANERYRLDPVHTRVLFSIEHAGFSHALGTVSGTTGRLWFDEDDWSSAAVVAATVDFIALIATSEPAGADWLAFSTHDARPLV